MTPVVVRMTLVVYLEAERVLQVVARLFLAQSRDDGRSLGDVYDLEAACFRQQTGDLVKLVGSRHAMGALAEVELTQRADVAEFTDAHVPVVVGQTMRVAHRTGSLAEQDRAGKGR